MTDSLELSLGPLSGLTPSAASTVRLVATGSDVAVLMSKVASKTGGPLEMIDTELSSVSVASPGSPRLRLKISQRLPVFPAWDVRVREGQLEVVYEVAEGATYRLERRTEGAEPTVIATRSLASFGRPRFVRGDVSGTMVSAIVDATKLVVLSLSSTTTSTPSEADAPRSPAGPPPIADALDGVVVGSGGRRSAFVKVFQSGPVRGDSIMRGTVQQIGLDDAWRPASSSQSLLSDTTVFELDVAATDAMVAVLATVERGAMLLHGRLGSRGFEVVAQHTIESTTELTSPTVLILGDTIHLAAIRGREVVVGRRSVATTARAIT